METNTEKTMDLLAQINALNKEKLAISDRVMDAMNDMNRVAGLIGQLMEKLRTIPDEA
ncbi:MAG TPA: hypothetical protein PK735_13610 [Flavobacteriales bacterium]|nr:hypothetical protein [Flavobacteriales bacterium]